MSWRNFLIIRIRGLLKITVKEQYLGRMAKVEEISNAIHYLASDQSSYMTGSILLLEAGLQFNNFFNFFL